MGGLSMLGARRLATVAAVAALLVVCCRVASAQLPTVRDPGQGVVSLSSGSTAAAELSGITTTGSVFVSDEVASSITQCSAANGATIGGFTPLSKTLLWQGDFAQSNFEGMTFGPSAAWGALRRG